MAKKKYYAVACGRRCGIFTTWHEAEKQVKGYGGAKYKSFAGEAEARSWLDNPLYEKKERVARTAPPLLPAENDSQSIVVYTDGGSINNPGPGGYGVVIVRGAIQQELSGGYRFTTNNRMEMMAAIVALQALRGTKKTIRLHSDSSYLVNGISRGWAEKWRNNGWRKADGGPVMNVDLWQKLLVLLDDLEVIFTWVKGHAGNKLNERCDQLAVASAQQKELPADESYEGLAKKGGQDGYGKRTV